MRAGRAARKGERFFFFVAFSHLPGPVRIVRTDCSLARHTEHLLYYKRAAKRRGIHIIALLLSSYVSAMRARANDDHVTTRWRVNDSHYFTPVIARLDRL